MRLSTDQLCARIVAHTGNTDDEARAAAHWVLATIGASLSPAHRALVSEELAADLARAMDEVPEVRMPGATPGQSRELVATVYRALAELLSTEAVRGMRRDLPADVAELLSPGAPAADTPKHTQRRNAISEAAPGSQRPISEADAGDLRQPDSVASANPYDDEKLSSARGTAQEQAGETLADGEYGSTRPVSSTRA